MFVYLESLDDYCYSCGIISLDDDMTDMVRSSYANKFVFICGFRRSGAIVAHQGHVQYHEQRLGRHVVTARQDESGYNFFRSCCSSTLIKWSCAFVTHVLEYT